MKNFKLVSLPKEAFLLSFNFADWVGISHDEDFKLPTDKTLINKTTLGFDIIVGEGTRFCVEEITKNSNFYLTNPNSDFTTSVRVKRFKSYEVVLVRGQPLLVEISNDYFKPTHYNIDSKELDDIWYCQQVVKNFMNQVKNDLYIENLPPGIDFENIDGILLTTNKDLYLTNKEDVTLKGLEIRENSFLSRLVRSYWMEDEQPETLRLDAVIEAGRLILVFPGEDDLFMRKSNTPPMVDDTNQVEIIFRYRINGKYPFHQFLPLVDFA